MAATHAWSAMENRVTSALIAIRRILRAAEFAARDLPRARGLTPSQLVALVVTAEAGGPSAGQAAAGAGISQATLTSLLDKLEARGLVERRRDPADGRRVSLALTEAGKALVVATPDALQDRFASRFEAIADWEQAQLIASLERVASLLGAEAIDASPIIELGPLAAPPEETPEKAD
jgi:DNA-binding MarR family transcriptional regulator